MPGMTLPGGICGKKWQGPIVQWWLSRRWLRQISSFVGWGEWFLRWFCLMLSSLRRRLLAF